MTHKGDDQWSQLRVLLKQQSKESLSYYTLLHCLSSAHNGADHVTILLVK